MKGENVVELDTYEGKRVRVHCTELGKAILVFRPREEVEEILDTHGMPAVTDRAITDRREFFAELKKTRERKYAADREERLMGLCCVAAPITDNEDRSIEAISVACPLHCVGDKWF